MTIKILIPYNFTVNDEKSINFVINRFVEKKVVEITLFHAYSPVPEIDMRNNPVLAKLARETSYLKHQQTEKKERFDKIRQNFIAKGFEGSNIDCLFTPVKQDIADDIIKLCITRKFKIVVLARNPGNIVNYFTRSISKKVNRKLDGKAEIHVLN